jgi:hypothetical protein
MGKFCALHQSVKPLRENCLQKFNGEWISHWKGRFEAYLIFINILMMDDSGSKFKAMVVSPSVADKLWIGQLSSWVVLVF